MASMPGGIAGGADDVTRWRGIKHALTACIPAERRPEVLASRCLSHVGREGPASRARDCVRD
jgi:hypothetical protein